MARAGRMLSVATIPLVARSLLTVSRSCGMVCSAKRCIAAGSSPSKMKVPMPSSSTMLVSCSALSVPVMLSRRRISAGLRPASAAASSMRALPDCRSPGLR
jgi:hypothetical protein